MRYVPDNPMKALLLASMCLLGFEMFAADGPGPKVGDKPPLLQATTLLQAPPGAKLDAKSLRGKVIVLEFEARRLCRFNVLTG